MKKITNTEMTRNINGGWTRCKLCNQKVNGSWWDKYKHCLKHASRCLPWDVIMDIAFSIWC